MISTFRLNPTKAYNPCPICSDTSGDCRIRSDNLVLCHSFIEQDSGVGGYKFLKTSTNGVWGVHVIDQGQEFNREKYEQYLARKTAQEQDKKQFLADNALDAEERDQAIRKLSRSVGLSSRSRQDLKRRGLSARAIEAGLFFSIDPWIRFNLNLPDNLPGIHYKGDRFATKDSGYACPIFDEQGRAIGWQLRITGVNKGNKYKWAKSSFSSHLPNGELPITIVKPKENTNSRLYLSEGVLKPVAASNRHNLSVCGAAGGYFSGSPQQFSTIQQNYDQFALAPDAGDILNPQVMKRWSTQINFLKQFNKPIQILWWGQIDKKKHQDLDEIDSETLAQAESLTPQEFFTLAKKLQWIQEQWDNWQNYKKFTSQIKIKKRFVEFRLPEKQVILFIKAALGTGKTTQLIKILEQLPESGILNQGYRNTLLLQFNEKAGQLGFYHLQTDKNLREFSLDDPHVRVSNCIDSLIHFVKEQFDGKIVVLDEVVSVIKHLLYSRTIKDFSKVKELFTEMIVRAERIICLDGFMQDWVVKFFKEVCPGKQVVTLENLFQGDKPQTYLLEGTIDIDEKIKTNDKTPWLEKLLNSTLPAIFSDSQVFCEAIENLLLQQGRSGLRIDSKTVGTKEVKEFLKNPDQWIADNLPDYLIGSPSIESGLDVSIENYFSEHFAFFFGQLDIDSCKQILGRIRDSSVPKYIWCKKFIRPEDINRRPSNLEGIQADRARRLMSELHFTLDSVDSPDAKIARIQQIYQDNLDPYTTAADTIQAIRNFEWANYRECLKFELINNGYPVESVTLESLVHRKAIAQQEREAKTEVKQQNATDIFNASDKYIGQQTINLNFDASWSTRCAVIKALLVNQLPGINNTSVWSAALIKLLKYDKPNLIRQTELYYLLSNPELAKQLAQEKYNKIFNRGQIAAPWKLRQDFLTIKALRDIGLWDFIQMIGQLPGYTYNLDTPEVKEILKKCSYHKNRQILGAPGKYPLKFFNNLMRSLGIEINCHQAREQRDKSNSNSRKRTYSINYQSLLSTERLAILQAIKLKYEEKIKLKAQPLEWLDNSPNSQEQPLNSSGSANKAQTIATHSLNSVTHQPLCSINNSTICDNLNNPQSGGNQSSESHNTDPIQNDLDSEESITDLASMLSIMEDVEQLSQLLTVEEFTPERLNQSWMRLAPDKRRQIAIWAKQIKTGQVLDFNYVIQQINQQIKRIGGTIQYWKEYLLEKYNVASRLLLSDDQLIEFWNDLINFPAPPNLE